MRSLSKLFTGIAIVVLGLVSVQTVSANPVVGPPEILVGLTILLIGVGIVVAAILLSVFAIIAIKKRKNKQ